MCEPDLLKSGLGGEAENVLLIISQFSSKNMSWCEFSLIITQGIEPDSQIVLGHLVKLTKQFKTLY